MLKLDAFSMGSVPGPHLYTYANTIACRPNAQHVLCHDMQHDPCQNCSHNHKQAVLSFSFHGFFSR